MTRSIFGWSLPPGVTTLPGDELEAPLPGDPGWPRCTKCGGWLKGEPEDRGDRPAYSPCKVHAQDFDTCEDLERRREELERKWDGESPPNEEEKAVLDAMRGCQGRWAASLLYRTCAACGTENVEAVL